MGAPLFEHLDKLQYFLTIAEEGSLSLASKRLRLTQPTLSHALRILEECLGTQLFERSPRGVALTDSGEKLRIFARKLATETLALESEINPQRGNPSLRIAAKEPWAAVYWPSFLSKLKQASISGTAKLHIARTNNELLSQLRSGAADVAIIPDPPDTGDIQAFEISKDRLGFYVAASVKAQADQLPIFVFRRAMAGPGKRVGTFLDDSEIETHRLKDVDSFTLSRSLALSEQGIGLIPQTLAKEAKLTEIKVGGITFPEIPICLCTLGTRIPLIKLRRLVRSCRAD